MRRPGPATAASDVIAGPVAERRPAPAPWRQPSLVGAVAAGATAYTGLMDPDRSAAFPFCPLKLLTGLDCPFCGSLRATHALVHGHLAAAADHNVLFVLAVPVLVVLWVLWFASTIGWPVRRPRLPARAWWALSAVAVMFMVARNLPVAPLHWLAST